MVDALIAQCIEGRNGQGCATYRHIHTGQKLLASLGESLPGRKSEGGWFAFAHDNASTSRCQPILMGRDRMWVSSGPEVWDGDEISILANIIEELRGPRPRLGRYRVSNVRPRLLSCQKGLHIDIELVGETDPAKVVYLAELFN